MLTARALLQGHIDGLTGESLTPSTVPISCAWQVDNAAGTVTLFDLASGTTALTPPPGAFTRMLILIPPVTNAIPLTLVGASGDTGIQLAANCAHVLTVLTTAPLSLKTTGTIPGMRAIWL